MSRLKRETLTVRGEMYIVREWTLDERGQFIAEHEKDKSAALSVLVTSCTINEDGSRRFATTETVRAEPASVVDDLAEAILRLSAGDPEKNA